MPLLLSRFSFGSALSRDVFVACITGKDKVKIPMAIIIQLVQAAPAKLCGLNLAQVVCRSHGLFSGDVDLTCDIRALAPELVRTAPGGIDAIPPTRSQEKKWSDEIRREFLPVWLRDHAHPTIQTGLEGMKGVSSRVTEDCIFIDYEPVAPASGYALPSVKLEFGARSSGDAPWRS